MAIFSQIGKYRNTGILIMRVGLGIMMITHGYPKLMGGPEQWGKVGTAIGQAGIHFGYPFWGFMSGFAEAVGGLLVILGYYFRPACILIILNLLVATNHHFASGDGLKVASHAIETCFAFIGLLFIGPGKYSIDKK